MQPGPVKDRIAAVIVAAGSGARMGGSVKKQFLTVMGKPVLQHTLERFQACPEIDEIIVVVPGSDCDEMDGIINNEWRIARVAAVVAGGNVRYESVINGVDAVSANVGMIAIHDGVRPCIRNSDIVRVLQSAQKYGAAILAVKPKDTIKLVEGEVVSATLDREHLIQVQTPQIFRKDILAAALRHVDKKSNIATDDSWFVEQLDQPVHVVYGDYMNIKITTPDDLVLAERYLDLL